MRLKRFEIINFKGIRHLSFEWEKFITLIGENNVGKSSILQALNWFLGGTAIKDRYLCFNHSATEDERVELIGYFTDLSAAEKGQVAVAGRMIDEEWILKKSFWCDADGSWKELYYSKSQEEVFEGWPETTASWNSFPPTYTQAINLLPDRGARPNAAKLLELRRIVRETASHLITRSEAKWVANPGGGGNWKSNANSILPRPIFVKAVQDAASEAVSKDASSYGKIISLLVEKKMMGRPEIAALKVELNRVLALFNPDPDSPELQAEEIRAIQNRINENLNQIVGGAVRIRTAEPDLQPMLLPNTTLIMKAAGSEVETVVEHQGHGLQRTLIITLLQVLSAVQAETADYGERATMFMIEEPELYLHPQMARKMRDVLYRVSSQESTQAICCSHSPVFLDMGGRHRDIVRVVKEDGEVVAKQVLEDLFDGDDAEDEKERLKLVSEFHPGVNEVFFAKRVVLCEGRTEIAAFERAAKKTGIFDRHPNIRHDVSLIDCDSKQNIPLFQKVLNHFMVPYLAVYDEDSGNAVSMADNPKIDGLAAAGHPNNSVYRVGPIDIENLLGYAAGAGSKPLRAMRRIDALTAAGGSGLPAAFLQVLNTVYFGTSIEPVYP